MKEILVSRGFGAGWSTWAFEKEKEIAEYRPIIDFLESGGKVTDEKFVDLVAQMKTDLDLNYFYTGGADGLYVATVDDEYAIEEYHGSESIIGEWAET